MLPTYQLQTTAALQKHMGHSVMIQIGVAVMLKTCNAVCNAAQMTDRRLTCAVVEQNLCKILDSSAELPDFPRFHVLMA